MLEVQEMVPDERRKEQIKSERKAQSRRNRA